MGYVQVQPTQVNAPQTVEYGPGGAPGSLVILTPLTVNPGERSPGYTLDIEIGGAGDGAMYAGRLAFGGSAAANTEVTQTEDNTSALPNRTRILTPAFDCGGAEELSFSMDEPSSGTISKVIRLRFNYDDGTEKVLTITVYDHNGVEVGTITVTITVLDAFVGAANILGKTLLVATAVDTGVAGGGLVLEGKAGQDYRVYMLDSSVAPRSLPPSGWTAAVDPSPPGGAPSLANMVQPTWWQYKNPDPDTTAYQRALVGQFFGGPTPYVPTLHSLDVVAFAFIFKVTAWTSRLYLQLTTDIVAEPEVGGFSTPILAVSGSGFFAANRFYLGGRVINDPPVVDEWVLVTMGLVGGQMRSSISKLSGAFGDVASLISHGSEPGGGFWQPNAKQIGIASQYSAAGGYDQPTNVQIKAMGVYHVMPSDAEWLAIYNAAKAV